jgi:hypothetical protein
MASRSESTGSLPSCELPSISITSLSSGAQKSRMNRPTGCCRRNFIPSSRLSRSSFQSTAYASVGALRWPRANSITGSATPRTLFGLRRIIKPASRHVHQFDPRIQRFSSPSPVFGRGGRGVRVFPPYRTYENSWVFRSAQRRSSAACRRGSWEKGRSAICFSRAFGKRLRVAR